MSFFQNSLLASYIADSYARKFLFKSPRLKLETHENGYRPSEVLKDILISIMTICCLKDVCWIFKYEVPLQKHVKKSVAN